MEYSPSIGDKANEADFSTVNTTAGPVDSLVREIKITDLMRARNTAFRNPNWQGGVCLEGVDYMGIFELPEDSHLLEGREQDLENYLESHKVLAVGLGVRGNARGAEARVFCSYDLEAAVREAIAYAIKQVGYPHYGVFINGYEEETVHEAGSDENKEAA